MSCLFGCFRKGSAQIDTPALPPSPPLTALLSAPTLGEIGDASLKTIAVSGDLIAIGSQRGTVAFYNLATRDHLETQTFNHEVHAIATNSTHLAISRDNGVTLYHNQKKVAHIECNGKKISDLFFWKNQLFVVSGGALKVYGGERYSTERPFHKGLVEKAITTSDKVYIMSGKSVLIFDGAQCKRVDFGDNLIDITTNGKEVLVLTDRGATFFLKGDQDPTMVFFKVGEYFKSACLSDNCIILEDSMGKTHHYLLESRAFTNTKNSCGPMKYLGNDQCLFIQDGTPRIACFSKPKNIQ